MDIFFFKWAKISFFNILYIFYKILGDRDFGSNLFLMEKTIRWSLIKGNPKL